MLPTSSPGEGRGKRRYGSNANTDVMEPSDAGEGTPLPPPSLSLSPQHPPSVLNRTTSSPRLSVALRELQRRSQFSGKRRRERSNSDRERETDYGRGGEDEDEDEEEPCRLQTRQTVGDSRRSGSGWSTRERGDDETHEVTGFFHDLGAMQPLRVRLGVCPLPESTGISMTTTTTALLLPQRKFFTLPEDKGGSDIIGWAAAFPAVSIDLPGEGVYNKASVSVTVMLPP